MGGRAQRPLRLSVVVVSDFEPGGRKTWRDELRIAHALAAQDIDQPFEIIFVETTALRCEPVPDALNRLLPDARLVFSPADTSAALKDHGVRLAAGEWVAVMEADSAPQPDWLRLVFGAAQQHDHVDAVSGLTCYGDETSYKRVMSLLDRSYNDTGRSKECSFVSNNGALYRKVVIERFPYPDAITPFYSARLRNLRMRERGHRFYFERRAVMIHRLGGLDFIFDAHTNLGYMHMKMEQRQSLAALPRVAWKYLWLDLRRCFWLGGLYLRWFDWPLALLLLLVIRVPELRGMLLAVRDAEALPGTAYR